MRAIFRDLRRAMRRQSLTLFFFEVILRGGGLIVLYPAFLALINLNMAGLGLKNLTSRNLVLFLGKPSVIATLVFFALLLAVLFLFEYAGIAICLARGRAKEKLGLSELYMLAIRKTLAMLKDHHGLPLFYALLLIPLIFLPVLALCVFTFNPVFYLGAWIIDQPVRLWTAIVAGLLILVISLQAAFSLPAYLHTGKLRSRRGLRRIEKDGGVPLARRVPHVVRVLLVTWASALLLALLLYVLLQGGAVIYARNAVSDANRLSYLIGFRGVLLPILLVALMSQCAVFGLSMLDESFLLLAWRAGVKTTSPDESTPLGRAARNRMRAFLFITMVFILLVFFLRFRYDIHSLPETIAETSVTAHRGGDSRLQENSLTGLLDSIDARIPIAEIDVQETADGVVVLMHDLSLRRTTGVKGMVYDMTYADILEAQQKAYRGDSFETDYVPTLISVLEMCRGKILLNIEIKSHPRYTDHLVEKVVELIGEYSSEVDCMISSMDYGYLERVKELNPDIRTGYIMSMAYGNVRHLTAADFLSVRYSSVSERLVTNAHDAGLEVHVWTVNSREGLTRMKAYNVDSVITDRPAFATEVLATNGGYTGYLDLLRFLAKR